MKTPRIKLVLPALAIVAVAWFFRAPLREKIRENAILANDAPAAEIVTDWITQSPRPIPALLAAWNSGKIVHREAALGALSTVVPGREPLPAALEEVLLSAALDPDMSVREAALGMLQSRQHPALHGLAAAQLRDPDPWLRQLGLRYLKQAPAELGVPLAAALLHDPDLAVLGMAMVLLEHRTGEKFGSRLSDGVQVENRATGIQEFLPEGATKTKAAAEQASRWWAAHKDQFPAAPRLPEPGRHAQSQRVRAGDFELADLNGKKVRLSDFRGKVVLINFWTTWCTACVGEIPALVALRQKRPDNLVILGVSLDYVPDSHGHVGGHAAVEEQSHSEGDHDDHESESAASKRVREKVLRTAKARGINYPVLLDEQNAVGGGFNGGELPTTLIVDAEGLVRRRFIGARSLQTFEAMVDDAARPAE